MNETIVGIDEAGRGPVVGPMVVAGVVFKQDVLEKLREEGVKDSKKLTRKRREELFDFIIDNSLAFTVVKVHPDEIDRENLNSLTYNAVNRIISSFAYLSPSKVTIDKVGQEREVIDYAVSMGIRPNVVYRADVDFVECSAASVLAKVIRDRVIDEIRNRYGEIGSGYPSDRRTVKWISEVYRRGEPPPPFIRRTWKILKRIAPSYYIEKRGVMTW